MPYTHKLFKIIAAVSILLVLANCKTSQLDSMMLNMATQVHIKSLEAIDLSENYKTLSSKKDEILLFAYYLEADSVLTKAWTSEFLSFTETDKKRKFETTLAPHSLHSPQLVFILIEMDTKRNADDLDRIFQSNFRLLYGIEKDKTTLQLLLGDDDLLDLQIIQLDKLTKQDNNKIKFSGVHLFDEYEYILHCKFD